MQVSASENCDRTNLREPFSSQFPSSSKGQINEVCLLHNVVYETPQTLCEEDSLVADAAVLRLPGILSAPGITLHFNVLPVLCCNW